MSTTQDRIRESIEKELNKLVDNLLGDFMSTTTLAKTQIYHTLSALTKIIEELEKQRGGE